jgi:hypothetical protein
MAGFPVAGPDSDAGDVDAGKDEPRDAADPG